MDAIKYQFSSKKFLIIIILISLFLGAAFYVYNNYIAPRLNPKFVSNREFTKEEAVNNTELYFIFADWCPYSKKVMPIWDNLKEKYDRKKVNNYAVIFKELDGDKNESEIDDFSKRFNKKIEGYPTIILIKQNEVIEFDADTTKENLTAFIEKTL